MHHPDTHTHAHIHTHQKQWAVKRCPYPPQTASTNQIRPDQNMPFKVRAGAGGGVRGAQPTLWPWEQLAWPERERDRNRDWERECGGAGGLGRIKKEVMQKHPHLTRSANTGWSPLRAHSAQGPGLTNHLLLPRSLFTRAPLTPPPPPWVPQCEPWAQVSPWVSRGLVSASSSDLLSLDPPCHIWFCRSLGSIRSLCVWGK